MTQNLTKNECWVAITHLENNGYIRIELADDKSMMIKLSISNIEIVKSEITKIIQKLTTGKDFLGVHVVKGELATRDDFEEQKYKEERREHLEAKKYDRTPTIPTKNRLEKNLNPRRANV